MSLPAHDLQKDLRVVIDVVGTIGRRGTITGKFSGKGGIENAASKGFMIISVTRKSSDLFKRASRGFDKAPIHAGSQIAYLQDLVGSVLTHDSSPFFALACCR